MKSLHKRTVIISETETTRLFVLVVDKIPSVCDCDRGRPDRVVCVDV